MTLPIVVSQRPKDEELTEFTSGKARIKPGVITIGPVLFPKSSFCDIRLGPETWGEILLPESWRRIKTSSLHADLFSEKGRERVKVDKSPCFFE